MPTESSSSGPSRTATGPGATASGALAQAPADGINSDRVQAAAVAGQVPFRRWLLWPLLLLLAIVAFGHVQGLRGVLCLAIGVAALASRTAPADRVRPLIAWWLAWLAIGAASAVWSANPELTLRSTVYELVLPLIVFVGAAQLVGSESSLRAAAAAVALGVVGLAALSLQSYLSGGPLVLLAPELRTGVTRFHPGVGVASTLAALAFPFWLMLLRAGRVWRGISVLLVACTLAVGAAAPNRMFWITLFGTTILFVVAKQRRLSVAALWRPALYLGVAGTLAVALLASTMQQRASLSGMGRPDVIESLATDARVAIWAGWSKQVGQRPILGAGFGKDVPSVAATTGMPPEVAPDHPVFRMHAHNLFLNTLLQVGIVGLVIQVGLLAALARYFIRALAHPRTAIAGRAGIALVGAMVLKNATDDFMAHGIVIAFWAFAGVLVGVIARASDEVGSGSCRAPPT